MSRTDNQGKTAKSDCGFVALKPNKKKHLKFTYGYESFVPRKKNISTLK